MSHYLSCVQCVVSSRVRVAGELVTGKLVVDRRAQWHQLRNASRCVCLPLIGRVFIAPPCRLLSYGFCVATRDYLGNPFAIAPFSWATVRACVAR